ncbi:hypothetical protein UFOVP62_11 [uncultured Caudovirales phage]|uniref:Uncharacterized protein n=1 Tax=uncultured Caudovirales phage TaxID=2100421 RepID=A0A6J5KU40_9CAUD|nr:hypothetical protein UFOVP62_11 [uncultured Caudovirales phage]
MNVNFPSPPSTYSQTTIISLLDTIRRAFLNVVSTDAAVSRVLLQAPNGTVYEVAVSNTGTLTTSVNDGKSRI